MRLQRARPTRQSRKLGVSPAAIVPSLGRGAEVVGNAVAIERTLLEGQTLEQWSGRNGPMPPGLLRELFDQRHHPTNTDGGPTA